MLTIHECIARIITSISTILSHEAVCVQEDHNGLVTMMNYYLRKIQLFMYIFSWYKIPIGKGLNDSCLLIWLQNKEKLLWLRNTVNKNLK